MASYYSKKVNYNDPVCQLKAIPGILQARTPEWVAISFSNA